MPLHIPKHSLKRDKKLSSVIDLGHFIIHCFVTNHYIPRGCCCHCFYYAVVAVVKLALEAGKATPAPPVGPALGSKGVNIMAFCKEYNAKTADKAGYVIPVEITVFDVSTSQTRRIRLYHFQRREGFLFFNTLRVFCSHLWYKKMLSQKQKICFSDYGET